MGATTDFPNIDYVFGFFDQHWGEIYDWQNQKPSYPPVIRFFKKVDSPERLKKAVVELKELIKFGENFDDEEWYDYFMSDSSLGYYPPGGKQTYKEWLRDVLKILEEPMEETEKHFIVRSAFDVKWEKLSEEEKREYNEYQAAKDRLRELGYSGE